MSRKRRTLIGFKPDPQMDEVMARAQRATGADLSEIVTRCIRKSLIDVIQELESERRHEAADLARLMLKEDFSQLHPKKADDKVK